MTQLALGLQQLYEERLKDRPGDVYLREHCRAKFLAGTVRVFRFYEPFLPAEGRVLDWGCRHAPDACLTRACRPALAIDACDLIDPAEYQIFFRYADLRYERLEDEVRLPYPDGAFDAVIAAGVLEHVPVDYESLKELRRVLRPGGRLIVTYLPNRASVEEWLLRFRGREHHARLYGLAELRGLLLHAGFMPLAAGYQTRLDLLPGGSRGTRLLRLLGAHRFASCLCAVAEKVVSL
jgi:SAM-dependent methyltransferase